MQMGLAKLENKNAIFVVITLASTLGQFAADLYLPSLSVLNTELHSTYFLSN